MSTNTPISNEASANAASQTRADAVSRESSLVDSPALPWLTLLLAGLASTAVEMLVADPSASPWIAAAIGFAQALGAAGVYAFVAWRGGFRGPMPRWAIAPLLLALAAPFALEPARRALFAMGRPQELLLLDSFRLLTLALAALGGWKNGLYPAAASSVFLMLFASALSENPATGWLLALFAAVAAWWLAEASWHDLAGGFRERRERVPAAALAFTVVVVVVTTAVAHTTPARWGAVLGEWFDSSGGTGDHDPNARGGVNDGDQLAAGENPRSGGGDGEQFIESTDPTLYDAINERYGKPHKPKNQQRAIALLPTNVTQTHDRVARGDSAQREFSLARRSPPAPRNLRDLTAEALFSVRGPTPVHFPFKRFDRFDGTTWSECAIVRSRFEPVALGSSWISLPTPTADYVAGPTSHRIKLGKLKSRRLPLPHQTTQYRLGAAWRPDFYHLATVGFVDLADPTGHVPPGEHLHTVETTIDRARCATLAGPLKPVPRATSPTDASAAASDAPPRIVAFDGYAVDPRIVALAEDWTRDVPRGWPQVEAIVARLRSGWTHDRAAVVPEEHPDPLAWFLFESKRGPDYLFAASAAVMLRTLGWPARLVNGGYADPANYDRAADYTHVGANDLHFWLEARLADGLWLPLEPTPGYDLAPHVRTWRDWLRDLGVATLAGLRNNVAPAIAALATLAALAWFRRDVQALAAAARWAWFARGATTRVVAETLRLIETRQRLAGLRRPPGRTPRRFFLAWASGRPREEPLTRRVSAADEAALVALFDLHDRAAFGSLDGVSENAARAVCREALVRWPWRKFAPAPERATPAKRASRERAALAI